MHNIGDFILVGEGCCSTIMGDCIECIEIVPSLYDDRKYQIRANTKHHKPGYYLTVHTLDMDTCRAITKTLLEAIKNSNTTYVKCIHIDDIFNILGVKV